MVKCTIFAFFVISLCRFVSYVIKNVCNLKFRVLQLGHNNFGRVIIMAYDTEIEICKEAREILDKNGLSVSARIEFGYDRRDFFSDKTTYEILKDGELIFGYACMGEKDENKKDLNGEFARDALKVCLECASDEKYLEQARSFKRALTELLELRKSHKFSKFGQKRDLKDTCEKLCRYYTHGRFPVGEPNIHINVPLMEDNREIIATALKELEELAKGVKKSSDQKDEKESATPAGPQNM